MTIKKDNTPSVFFDFGYGEGLELAHRHCNGGGWVADSAHVEDTVYIGVYARVCGAAIVSGNVHVTDWAEIKDSAIVRDNVRIKDKAKVQGYSLIEGKEVVLLCWTGWRRF